MSATEIDRLPISLVQASTGLGRSAFYKRLGQAGIEPIRVCGCSFLDQLGGSTALAAPAPWQLQAPLLEPEPDRQAPEDLVAAEVEHLDRVLFFLTKEARLGWKLPTSKVEQLLGSKPRGANVERYGFIFLAVANTERNSAGGWSVEFV